MMEVEAYRQKMLESKYKLFFKGHIVEILLIIMILIFGCMILLILKIDRDGLNCQIDPLKYTAHDFANGYNKPSICTCIVSGQSTSASAYPSGFEPIYIERKYPNATQKI